MSGVTKKRHLEILGAAKEILADFGGTVKTDDLDDDIRREMANMIKSRSKCHIDTARRNLAKAMRQDRWRRMQEKETEPPWGGKRPNQTGRPRKEK